MAYISHLYSDLRTLMGQSTAWKDQRHLQTLVWMVIGLICSSSISLTKWTSYFQGRAQVAQSRQRRCSRWFHNPRIKVHQLYRPLIQGALASWGYKIAVQKWASRISRLLVGGVVFEFDGLPIFAQVFSRGASVMVLIMDTSMLWERYCLIRVCVQYRGRAVPIAWRVMEHGSSSVKFGSDMEVVVRLKPLPALNCNYE